jgi:hypothetical protein
MRNSKSDTVHQRRRFTVPLDFSFFADLFGALSDIFGGLDFFAGLS